MEQYIDKLSLSSEIILALRNIHITKVSDLDGLNYLTLAEKFPKGYNVTAIANELNSLGYLYPPENEISVYDISMSNSIWDSIVNRRNNDIIVIVHKSIFVIFFKTFHIQYSKTKKSHSLPTPHLCSFRWRAYKR